MSSDEINPVVEWDELTAAKDFHDVGEFIRGGETRIYRLRRVSEGAELWRITEAPGERRKSVRETLCKSSEEAAAFLEEVQRALIAGGWKPA